MSPVRHKNLGIGRVRPGDSEFSARPAWFFFMFFLYGNFPSFPDFFIPFPPQIRRGLQASGRIDAEPFSKLSLPSPSEGFLTPSLPHVGIRPPLPAQREAVSDLMYRSILHSWPKTMYWEASLLFRSQVHQETFWNTGSYLIDPPLLELSGAKMRPEEVFGPAVGV